jgi:hypothetical protein
MTWNHHNHPRYSNILKILHHSWAIVGIHYLHTASFHRWRIQNSDLSPPHNMGPTLFWDIIHMICMRNVYQNVSQKRSQYTHSDWVFSCVRAHCKILTSDVSCYQDVSRVCQLIVIISHIFAARFAYLTWGYVGESSPKWAWRNIQVCLF